MDISIPRIWQRVGRRHWQEEMKAEALAGSLTAAQFVLALHWQATPYLAVRAFRGKDDFAQGKSAVIPMFEAHGLSPDALPAAIRSGRNQVVGLEVGRNDVLVIEFEIDTNDSRFIDEANAVEGPALLTKQIETLVVARGSDASAKPTVDSQVVYLHLEPAKKMERFDGVVAIDLGNTNSTLVCLDSDSRGDAYDIEVVNLEKAHEAGPIPSAIRIRDFKPSDDPDEMESVSCVIGRQANEPPGWLVLGAKRLLADTDTAHRHEVVLEGQRHALNKSLPSELFLCGLFRAFHEDRLHVPRQIAVTCPATFSDWETKQLREAVVQGWRRSLGAPGRKYDPKKIREPELPDMIIDEASAAAFYFLYHDYIDVAGGLDVLNYLHGGHGGLNLLVYDCGGGTTDIALVHAVADKRNARLTIKVLGRTGHRCFGGDDITTAAFRVLKARLACMLSSARLRYPEVPSEVGAVADFIRRHQHEIDEAVPTRFSRENLSLADHRRRMQTTEHLWRWAEWIKIDLGKQSPSRAAYPAAQSGIVKNLAAEHPGKDKYDEEKLEKVVQNISVHREEVDALIREELSRSIQYANQMIRAKIPDDEVHCVYVVGNASRYPLIGEMIRKELDVPFIEQRIKHVSTEDLKNSVAKGAVLALRVSTRAENLDVDFDRKLADKLPFDVTFSDRAVGGDRVLYHENEVYQELKEKQIPSPDIKSGEDEKKFKEIFLGRRWPGDDRPSPFLRFQFEDVIRGPVKVWYDIDKHRFYMRDENGSRDPVEGVEKQEALYCAPVQSGEL